jgi:two-component system sensor histidine kinase KdpD
VLFSVVALAVATGLTYVVAPFAPNVSLGGLYLLAVVPVAALFGLGIAIVVSVVSMALFASIFLSPTWSLSLQSWQTWVALAVYVVTSIVVSQLAVVFRNRAVRAEQGEREAAFLAAVSSGLLTGTVRDRLGEIAARAAAVLEVEDARISLVDPEPSVQARPLLANGSAVAWLSLADDAEPDPRVAERVLPALASLLAVGLERERLALELVETAAVRRSDAMKTAILRSVSHDLRSPLTAIRAASAGLQSRSVRLTGAEREALVETICAEARRLDRLVGDLLDLSRLEAGAAQPVPELWTLDELLAGVLEAIGAEADRVDVTLPPEVPALLVDGAQIERALANIVGNALKFSQDGGRVEVSVETSGGEIVTRVQDSGPGVYGEFDRLFLPFQTGGARLNGSGPGLGLAIAKGFTELNGGRVWCERSSKGGASFAVAFPKARSGVSIA